MGMIQLVIINSKETISPVRCNHKGKEILEHSRMSSATASQAVEAAFTRLSTQPAAEYRGETAGR
jgi:hypothetical protein